MLESVVLPAPFSPSSACTSPTAASKSTPSFATTPGKRLLIPTMRTAGTEEAPAGPAPLPFTSLQGARSPTGLRRRDLGDTPLDAPHEPLHRVQVRQDLEPLAGRDHELPALVVQRA